MSHDLYQRWTSLCTSYSENSELIQQFWDEISDHYSDPERTYHNFSHLVAMMNRYDQCQEEIDDKDCLLFAIFYHDIIYQFGQNDNEVKSAELAVNRLTDLGLTEEKVHRCYELIVATKSHDRDDDKDVRFMLDIDIGVLAETKDDYLRYTSEIRKEYRMYSDEEYRKGRILVLQRFLEMPRIFKSDFFHQKHEEQARINLESELHLLKEAAS